MVLLVFQCVSGELPGVLAEVQWALNTEILALGQEMADWSTDRKSIL